MHRCTLHLFLPGKRKFRVSLSCGPAPKPPKPSCLSTETVALGKAWVGDANLNLTRARKESLTHSTPPEKRNLTQLLLLQSRLPRLKRTRSYYFQVCKCFLLFEDRLLQFPVRQDTGYITIKNNLAYLRNSLKSNRLDTCACGLDIFIPQLF